MLFSETVFARRQSGGVYKLTQALFKAVIDGNLLQVCLLLSVEPRAVHWSSRGLYPLDVAVLHRNAQMTQLLLMHGADPHLVSGDRKTAQARAIHLGWALRSTGLEINGVPYEDMPNTSRPSQPRTSASGQAPGAGSLSGAFNLTAEGHLRSATTGRAVAFENQKAAARWILDEGCKSQTQVFEIANHPTQSGRFTVKGRPRI